MDTTSHRRILENPNTGLGYPPLFDKDGRIRWGEGIDPFEIYQDAQEKYQDEITHQGCCWYLSGDIAVFDRTDHIERPEAFASAQETSMAADNDESSESSEFEEPVAWDWLYEMGGREAYAKAPHAKQAD